MGLTPRLGIEYPDGADPVSRKSWIVDPLTSVDERIAAYLNDRIKSGSLTVTPSGANVDTYVTVTFTKPFATQPRVTVSIYTGIGAGGSLDVWASSVTPSGFRVYVRRSNTTPTSVSWIATDLAA